MNGENPNNQANNQPNEFNGGVLGTPVQPVQPTPVVPPVEPVAPVTPAVEPAPAVQTTVEAVPVQPVEPVQPAPVAPPVEPVAPVAQPAPAVEPTVAAAPVQPVQPTPVVPPVEPVAPVTEPAPAVDPTVAAAPAQPAVGVAPIPQPVEPAPAAPTGPVAQPIPGTEGLVATPQKGKSAPGIANQNPAMMSQQKATNIGTNPPAGEQAKKPMNKIVFIVLIVVLILGVAYGVYYFLTKSKKKLVITPKEAQIMSGMEAPETLNYYATVSSGDASGCIVDVSKIDTTKIGEYEATITCGEQKIVSKVKVVDITAPTVLTNIVFKTANNTIDVHEFINSCIDNTDSECTHKFVDEAGITGQMTMPGGPYEIGIESSDSAGNKVVTNATLYVTAIDTIVYTACTTTKSIATIQEYQVNKEVEDLFTIGDDGLEGGQHYVFLNAARRINRYEFETAEDYKAAIGEKTDTITFDGITGHAGYDDDNKTLTVSIDLPKTTLDSENNGQFPSLFTDIKSLYESKGYHCGNTQYGKLIVK